MQFNQNVAASAVVLLTAVLTPALLVGGRGDGSRGGARVAPTTTDATCRGGPDGLLEMAITTDGTAGPQSIDAAVDLAVSSAVRNGQGILATHVVELVTPEGSPLVTPFKYGPTRVESPSRVVTRMSAGEYRGRCMIRVTAAALADDGDTQAEVRTAFLEVTDGAVIQLEPSEWYQGASAAIGTP